MKFLKVMIIILLFVFSCEKDKPTEPDEPPVDDHEQGEVENYSVLYDDQGNIYINGVRLFIQKKGFPHVR